MTINEIRANFFQYNFIFLALIKIFKPKYFYEGKFNFYFI